MAANASSSFLIVLVLECYLEQLLDRANVGHDVFDY